MTPQLKTEVVGEHLIVELPQRMTAISSTVLNGGVSEIQRVAFLKVSKDFNDPDPRAYAENALLDLGVRPEATAVFLTAATPAKDNVIRTDANAGVHVVMTVGLSPLVCIDGEPRMNGGVGTINIVVVFDRPARLEALVDAVATATVAKAAALQVSGLGCGSPQLKPISTASDAILVAAPITETPKPIKHSGPVTPEGRVIAHLVYWGLLEAAKTELSSYEAFLRHYFGLSLEELVEEGMLIYGRAPVPGVGKGVVKNAIKQELIKVLRDPNVTALLTAARELDVLGAAGSLHGLPRRKHLSDWKGIVADEVLGMALATYLNGHRGLFSYEWIDRGKLSARLSKFPMFSDDALEALIGAILSRVYDSLISDEP